LNAYPSAKPRRKNTTSNIAKTSISFDSPLVGVGVAVGTVQTGMRAVKNKLTPSFNRFSI